MKIAIIADTHRGVRGDSDIFETNVELFDHQILFPFLRKHEIKTLIHLGDLVDRRKFIAFNTAQRLRKNFLEPLDQMDIHRICLVGNHDIFFRENLTVNAQFELLENWTIVDRPWNFNFGGLESLLVPWMCDANEKEIQNKIKTWHGKAVFGHFELAGFEMERGRIMDKGMDAQALERFELVASGHYHHQSQRGNVRYVGATREMTWADYDDPRGFHVLDTDTLQMEFIKNPYPVFMKIDVSEQLDENIDVANKVIRLTATENLKSVDLERIVQKIAKDNPASVQVVEKPVKFAPTDIELTDTLSMLMDSASEMDCDKDSLRGLLMELYKEAETSANP